MDDKTRLEELLSRYPRFFYKKPDGNNYKYASVLANELVKLKNQVYILKRLHDISRPLQIWREQSTPFVYSIKTEVNMENIKRVQLLDASWWDCCADCTEDCPDRNSTDIIQDSGILPLGTNKYTGSYNDALDPTETNEIIPSEKYILDVEDYDEHHFQKGFPENDTIEGDIFDHDSALDLLGAKLNIPRRNYDPSNITHLERTNPPYCTSLTEWDYYYAQRILQTLQYMPVYPLPVVELNKLFGVHPDLISLQGRWRRICHMDEDFMVDLESDPNSFYMSTDTVSENPDEGWNNAVYDVQIDLTKIPENIMFPSPSWVLSIVRAAFPLSKKCFFSLIRHYPDPSLGEVLEDVAGIFDDVSVNSLIWDMENVGVLDSIVSASANSQIEPETVGVADSVTVNTLISYYTESGVPISPKNPSYDTTSLVVDDGRKAYGDVSNGFVTEDGERIYGN